MADHAHHVVEHWIDANRFEGWPWAVVFAVFATGMFLALADL